MSRIIFLLATINIHQVFNVPLGSIEKQSKNYVHPNTIIPILNPNHEEGKVTGSVLVPVLLPSQQVTIVDKKLPHARKKKGPNIPITHHLLFPTQLHVIPIHSNIHHSTIHTGINLITNDNVHSPFVSHTYMHTTHSTSNVTHPSTLFLIPVHHTHLVPIRHDLSVIPLHRPIHNVQPKLSHYRTMMEQKEAEDEEPTNRFRSFYGGYGNGLYFGGHGAGHGFYAYG